MFNFGIIEASKFEHERGWRVVFTCTCTAVHFPEDNTWIYYDCDSHVNTIHTFKDKWKEK